VGRKSLASERREQILKALETCILEHGLAGSTFGRIAAVAGMQPSVIAHYFGNKDAVIDAVVEHTTKKYRDLFASHVLDRPASQQLRAVLEFLFGGAFTSRELQVVMGELITASHHDNRIREHIRRMYSEFEQICRMAVHAAHPSAPSRRSRDVSYALMCLADANTTFAGIGFGSDHHDRARRVAVAMLGTLAPEGGKQRRRAVR
jgi:AcrR family transcriptional regulator